MRQFAGWISHSQEIWTSRRAPRTTRSDLVGGLADGDDRAEAHDSQVMSPSPQAWLACRHTDTDAPAADQVGPLAAPALLSPVRISPQAA
jgi:hypothetical protein